jgi:hypothetical protein
MEQRIISGCTSGVYVVDFNSLPVITGNVYYLTFLDDVNSGCFTVGSITSSTPTVIVSTAISFTNSCSDCLDYNDGSALTGGTTNTQSGTIVYEDCITCSGDTFTQSLPHAIYSNAQGRSVIQVDSVALGGFNGLNS